MAGGRPGGGAALWAGGALVAASVVLLCLIPKPEGDLFFALRAGEDLLRSGRVPRADAYSWSDLGARWDVPEWGAFALYALAYRAGMLTGAGGLLGTWALMAALAVATALAAWVRLARHVGPAWAFPLASLMLLALSPCLQERPYAFSYPLLAVALVLVGRGRETLPRRTHHLASPHSSASQGPPETGGLGDASSRTGAAPLDPPVAGGPRDRGTREQGGGLSGLLVLPPLCAVWANLHQGVVVLPLLLLVYAAGDALGRDWARAGRMGLAAGACALAALASPSGWGLYRNVSVTLRDRALMGHITEWEPLWTLPVGQSGAFLLLLGVFALGLALSRRRPRLPDALVVAALFGEALLHVRNVALLAVGGMVVLAPHLGDVVERFRGLRPPASAWRGALLGGLALLYVGTVGLVALVSLRRAGYGARGVGLGAAAAELPDYPGGAAAFLGAGGAARPRRLLNDLGDGGYLLWRLPGVPVFIDGRLDVYAGRTFDDNLILVRADGSPAWAALVRRYDFDAVLTRSRREAAAFAALPGWRLVYEDPVRAGHPRHRLLVREDRNPHPALPLRKGGGFPEGRAATGGGSRRG